MTPLIGVAEDAMHRDALQRLADAYEAKCGSDWHFDVGDGVFGAGEDAAAVRYDYLVTLSPRGPAAARRA